MADDLSCEVVMSTRTAVPDYVQWRKQGASKAVSSQDPFPVHLLCGASGLPGTSVCYNITPTATDMLLNLSAVRA